MPKISIIVPIYKAEAYLHRCLDSILAQTFTDFEVLLVDDGSPDKSGEICDLYALRDSRVRVIHKDNGGVSSARQCGIDNALGEYIIHADPDDWIESNMLEDLYLKAVDEDADMVICDYFVNYIYSNEEKYHNQTPTALNNETVLSDLFQHLHGSCWNKLIRRKCFEIFHIKFPEGISYCEDLYVHASLLLHPIKIAHLPKAYYHYVQDNNANSLVKKYNIDTYNHDFKLVASFNKLLSNSKVAIKVKEWGVELIVSRAYRSRVFTSKQFKTHLGSYASDILHIKTIPFYKRLIYYMSCKGYYGLVLSLQDILSE